MNTLAPHRLPARVRRRVTAAYVAAALCLIGVAGVLALATYGMVWQPARAERLVSSLPHQTATYSWADVEQVELESGEVLPLWRPLTSYGGFWYDDGEQVQVVVVPGEGRALLVDDVAPADYPLALRILEGWSLVAAAHTLCAYGALAAYGVMRLVLGFSPLALGSLREGERGSAVVTWYPRLVGSNRWALAASFGSFSAVWEVRSSAPWLPLSVGGQMEVAGRIEPGGWIVASTETGATLVPCDPLRRIAP